MKVKEIKGKFAPVRMSPGAAGYDLKNAGPLAELQEGETVHLDTGFKVALPPGHVGLIRARSGAGFNYGVAVLAGVLDEDFRGEVRVALHRVVTRRLLYRMTDKVVRWVFHVVDKCFDGTFLSVADAVKTDAFEIKHGDRIAQLLVLPCYQEPVELVDELDETERGGGGFGSTGT